LPAFYLSLADKGKLAIPGDGPGIRKPSTFHKNGNAKNFQESARVRLIDIFPVGDWLNRHA